MQKEILIDLVTKKMPYGKYKGRLICDIPEHYLIWINRQGFPGGKLGMWLSTMYEIKLNGLEDIIDGLKARHSRWNGLSIDEIHLWISDNNLDLPYHSSF